MNKGKHVFRNIVWISILLVIIGLAMAFLLRNKILTTLLPSLVSNQTNELIRMDLDKAYVGWGGEGYLLNPTLSFDSVYLDKAKSLELEELSFDTVHLYGASLKSIISDGLFLADSLRVAGPKVRIREREGNVQKTDFNPDHLIALMGSKSIADSSVKIKLGNIRVDYGKLDLEALEKGADSINDIDFSMYIENFSTLPDDNASTERILFSDDIILKLSNIDKLLISGYDLDLGSLLFSIKKNRLRIDGVELFPHVLSDSLDQVALAAESIEFDGLSIHEIQGKDEINLNSARIYGGYFTTNTHKAKKSGREAHNAFFTIFADKIRHFHLDTLGIHDFNVEFMEYLTDSVAWVANLNMELYGVEIDSSMMDDLYREIVFDEFIITAGPMGYNKPEHGLNVLVDSIYHSSSSYEKTAIHNLEVHSVNTYTGKENVNITAGEIAIYGISEKSIFYPDKMDLSVFVKDFKGTIDPSNKNTSSRAVSGINIFDYLSLDTLSLDNASLSFAGNDVYTSSLTLINEQLLVKDIVYSTPPEMGNNRSSIGLLKINELSIEQIINDKALQIGLIQLNRIRSKGNFILPGNKKRSDNKLKLPFDHIKLGGFNINDCYLDTRVQTAVSTHSIKTNIQVTLDAISISGPYLDTDELATINARIQLMDTRADLLYHRLLSEEALIDLRSGIILLKGIDMQPLAVSGNPGFIIHELHLPNFEIGGLDFPEIIKDQEINLKELDYTKLSFSDISMYIELDPDSSSTKISVERLSIDHHFPARRDANFMDDFAFSFDSIAFEETKSHTKFSIGSGNYFIKGNRLTLKNLHGGNMLAGANSGAQGKMWDYSSDELIVNGLYVSNTLPSRLRMGTLILSNADIIFSNGQESRKSSNFELEMDSYRRFGNMMTNLRVDTTILNEVKIEYQTFTDTSNHSFLADSIRLVIHDIEIDTSVFDKPERDIIKKMSIDLNGRTRITKDSLYEIRSGRINCDFNHNIISIDSFEVTPRYGIPEFYDKAIYQTDRMSLFGERIEIHDFRLDELLHNDHLHFGNIDLIGMNMEMLRDKTYARKPNDFKPMPQEMLKNIKQKISIDSVRVIDSYMSYGEYVEKSNLPGTIFFDRFNLRMYGLSTDLPKADPTASIKIDLNAYVMGQARFNIDLVFPYMGDSSDFWMNASSEPLDLTILNPLTEHILGLSIKQGRGQIKESFITGNSTHSKGSMTFTYDKLKLNLYNRKKAEQNKGMIAGITRFLINDILIHKNNPKWAREPRIGQAYFERDQEKAMLNYVWKSLLSGMLSSVGINTKEQRQEKKEMKKITK